MTNLATCDSVDNYVNQIVSTTHQLRGIGFDISEEWIGTLLLAGLPEEYKTLSHLFDLAQSSIRKSNCTAWSRGEVYQPRSGGDNPGGDANRNRQPRREERIVRAPGIRALSLAAPSENLDVWRRRMGHLNVNSLNKLKNGLVTAVHFKESRMKNCVVCAKGKQFRQPLPKKCWRASEVLELVHTDLYGPIKDHRRQNAEDFHLFSQAKVRIRVFDCIQPVPQSHREAGKPKSIRSDNGKKFIIKSLQNC